MKCILWIYASALFASAVPGAFSAETVFTRTFPVTHEFIASKFPERVNEAMDFDDAIRKILADAGINISTNKGEELFYNSRTGILLVRATLSNLDVIQKLLQKTNIPAMVKLEVRMAEIPETNDVLIEMRASEQLRRLDLLSRSESFDGAHVLAETEFKEILGKLEKSAGVDLLSFPTVQAVSGRNVRIEFASEEPVFDPPFYAPGKP